MPVGCLGGDGAAACVANGSAAEEVSLDVMVTSAVLNAAEQMAFMQQTLLLQIFRTTTTTTDGRASSSSSSSSSSTSACPTCAAFGEQCCQTENGVDLFREFVEINLQCYWDAKLTEALTTLRSVYVY